MDDISKSHLASIARLLASETPVFDQLDREYDLGLLTEQDYRGELTTAYLTGRMNPVEVTRYQRAIEFW